MNLKFTFCQTKKSDIIIKFEVLQIYQLYYSVAHRHIATPRACSWQCCTAAGADENWQSTSQRIKQEFASCLEYKLLLELSC